MLDMKVWIPQVCSSSLHVQFNDRNVETELLRGWLPGHRQAKGQHQTKGEVENVSVAAR